MGLQLLLPQAACPRLWPTVATVSCDLWPVVCAAMSVPWAEMDAILSLEPRPVWLLEAVERWHALGVLDIEALCAMCRPLRPKSVV